jgi:plastocyanin
MTAGGARAAELASVGGAVSVVRATKGTGPVDNGGVAVWLKPVSDAGQPVPVNGPSGQRLRIVQRDKRFDPHTLVVPVGSVVDFPNLDPFFHNVFSLFDGKRFDLGLYEAGGSRGVVFSTPGVSYIFCNIHPEMSAVIVVVDTPYYAVTNRAGEFTVPNVPAGRYLLTVWHERGKPDRPQEFPRALTVSGALTVVDPIRLVEAGDVISQHKNKYGQDYHRPEPPGPLYRQ